jgi:DNA adenine methylase
MGRPKKTTGPKSEATPFLKWAGGKTQLLEALLARAPEKFGTYHEPFVGAGAFFFKLKALGRIKKARLADINFELMNAWKSLRDSPQTVIAELEVLKDKLSEQDFYAIRDLDPDKMTGPQRAARLIYLNKTCFNGLYRENKKGRFNVPFGRYKKAKVLDRENLLAVGKALSEVKVEQAPFTAILKHARPGDFVYFDPPYHPLSTTSSFTTYSRGGFGEEGQRQLAQVFAQLAASGVHVMLSNSDTPLIRKLFSGKGFEVHEVRAIRAINSKGDRRGAVTELLIVGGGEREAKAAEGAKDRQLALISPR